MIVGSHFEYRGNGSRDWRVEMGKDCSLGSYIERFWRGGLKNE